jgi:hypothetical protein
VSLAGTQGHELAQHAIAPRPTNALLLGWYTGRLRQLFDSMEGRKRRYQSE